jgi:hypothetical protein
MRRIKEKRYALSLAKECYTMRLNLLTGAIRSLSEDNTSKAKSKTDPPVIEEEKQQEQEL